MNKLELLKEDISPDLYKIENKFKESKLSTKILNLYINLIGNTGNTSIINNLLVNIEKAKLKK